MIELTAERDTVSVGQQFRVWVRAKAGLTNGVDAVQVYLEFAPDELEVIAFTAGARLEYLLQENMDNSAGRIDFAVGTLGDSVRSPFILATITFRAKSPTGPQGTYIRFSPLDAPRQTKAVAGGANITGDLDEVHVVVQ